MPPIDLSESLPVFLIQPAYGMTRRRFVLRHGGILVQRPHRHSRGEDEGRRKRDTNEPKTDISPFERQLPPEEFDPDSPILWPLIDAARRLQLLELAESKQ